MEVAVGKILDRGSQSAFLLAPLNLCNPILFQSRQLCLVLRNPVQLTAPEPSGKASPHRLTGRSLRRMPSPT